MNSLSKSETTLAAQRALAALHEGSLILEDGQSLLETCDLGCTACLALFVRLRLGNATLLELAIIVQNCGELRAGCVPITTELTDALIQALVLLGFIFGVLRLHSHAQLVLLSCFLVDTGGVSLRRLLSGQVLGEIGEAHFQNVND